MSIDNPVTSAEQPLHTAMTSFFADDRWPTRPLPDDIGVVVDIEGTAGRWSALAYADDAANRFLFYSIAPTDVPEERRDAMAEFLTRANHGMLVGNFEMDYTDGEVRFKTSCDLTGLPADLRTEPRLLYALVAELAKDNVTAFDLYLPGVVSVSFGHAEPRDVIEDIEREL